MSIHITVCAAVGCLLLTPNDFTNASDSLQSRLEDATVRISVVSEAGSAEGRGTVIQCENGKAIIVTCGHLFRGLASNQSVRVTVLDSGILRHAPGRVLLCDELTDLGLVEAMDVADACFVPLSSAYLMPSIGDPAFAIRYDSNERLKVIQTVVTAVGRFVGCGSFEVKDCPTLGCSGGGLASSRGTLIGVCTGINPERQSGIYVGASEVLRLLDCAEIRNGHYVGRRLESVGN